MCEFFMFISPFYVILDVFVLFDLYVSILHDIPKMVKVFIKNLVLSHNSN